jgi:hypothetical protein
VEVRAEDTGSLQLGTILCCLLILWEGRPAHSKQQVGSNGSSGRLFAAFCSFLRDCLLSLQAQGEMLQEEAFPCLWQKQGCVVEAGGGAKAVYLPEAEW